MIFFIIIIVIIFIVTDIIVLILWNIWIHYYMICLRSMDTSTWMLPILDANTRILPNAYLMLQYPNFKDFSFCNIFHTYLGTCINHAFYLDTYFLNK